MSQKLSFRRRIVGKIKSKLEGTSGNPTEHNLSPQEANAAGPAVDRKAQDNEAIGPEGGPISIRELWNEAYEKLRQDDTALVDDFEEKLCEDLSAGLRLMLGSKISRREFMGGILRRQMDRVNSEAWKFQFGNSNIQAKDMVQPVVGVINKANGFINAALNGNPCASLAWAGVSLLLPLLLNPSKQAISLAQGLDYISNLLIQSRIWEDLYIRRYESTQRKFDDASDSITQQGYKETLEILYMNILRLQVTGYCYYATNEAFRLGLDVVRWNDWDKLLGAIKDQESAFIKVQVLWRDEIYLEESQELANTYQETTILWGVLNSEVSSLRKAVQETQNASDNREFFQWLADVDPSEIYNTAKKRHASGTGDWLIKGNKTFQSWEKKPNSFLWLHGKAGCGKSILSSSVISYLREQHTSDLTTAITYFYFSFSDLKKQSVDQMLGSLIQQLCFRRPVIPSAVENLRDFRKASQRPDTNSLRDALLASLEGFTSVYVVLDALDECPVSKGERERLLEIVGYLATAGGNSLHIFCTSRKEPDIELNFEPLLCFPSRDSIDITMVTNGLREDLETYVDATLKSVDFDSWPQEVKDYTRTVLLKKSDGMFQYLSLQFDALRNLSIETSIREALDDLPTGLDGTYDRQLQKIEPKFRSQVTGSLKWLAFSNKVLTLDQLAEAFVIDPECTTANFNNKDTLFRSKDVLKYLSSLVVVEDGWDMEQSYRRHVVACVRLAHFSIKEYLLSRRINQGPAAYFAFTETEAHIHIACCSLVRLFQCSAMDDSERCRYQLKKYIASNLPRHLEMLPRETWPLKFFDAASRAFKMRSSQLEMIVKEDSQYCPSYMYPDIRSGDIWPHPMLLRSFCFTSREDFSQLTDILLESHLYRTQEDLDAVLQEAAHGGKIETMRLALRWGANPMGASPVFGSALHAAACVGNETAAKLLIDSGADVNAVSDRWCTALHVACSHSHLPVVKLLVREGANVNLTTYTHGSALVAAALQAGRNEDIMKFLIESGAAIDCLDNVHGPVLDVLVWNLEIRYRSPGEFISFLIELGFDLTHSGGYDYILRLLCQRRQSKSVYDHIRFLITRGANVNARGGKYGNALQAICGGESSIRRRVAVFLLENGAEINARGGFYETALQAACVGTDRIGNDEELVHLLVDKGADVNIQGGFYGNALQATCNCSNTIDIARLLLERGADVNAEGGEYGSALQATSAASERWHPTNGLLELLLSWGANVNQQGGRYGTPLQAAAALPANTKAMRVLLDHGACVNIEGGMYGTPLQAACASSNSDAMLVLLEHGADVHTQGGLFGSAWHAAAATLGEEHDKMLLALLKHGVDVNDTRGIKYPTALQAALEEADPEKEIGLREAIDPYVTRGSRIRLLVDSGADPEIMAGKYGFPLQSVCANERSPRAVECFLNVCPNININAQGGIFGSALQAAAYMSLPSTVQLLVGKGADINMRGGKYGSPLNAAVIRGFWDNVEVLLEAGARPDCQLVPEPDEAWLEGVLKEDGRGAVERYRVFWDVEKKKNLGKGHVL